uniref:AraC family transcriptional regulator n=1 Tax=Erysipelothrix rhusiopathiae TaxID=1648 RepID=A0A385XM16_ERYRH|nr:hypothetical protein [Erysipelothrix rhusiopathiae]AYC07665.1 AraC family transcriptional regulator [Erysipelothrix rhusiopathiae]
MKFTIQKKKAFTVAGVNEQNINSSLCSSVWGELFSKVSHEAMSKLGTGESVGVATIY